MQIVFFISGVILGIAGTWFALHYRMNGQDQARIEKNTLLTGFIDELKLEVTKKEASIVQLSSNLSARSMELDMLSQKLLEQKQEFTGLRELFNTEFKNLANEILEEKSKKFTEQNKTNIDLILKPLGDKIKDFEKKVDEAYDKEAQQRFSLKEEVKRLAELNIQISKEANSLTKALKGESKTQGNWGEVILESILVRTGLRKGHEYSIQESFTIDGARRLQPDVIVQYPGERSIIIDSKVSLTAYDNYVSATDDDSRSLAMKAHLTSVKNHINELASKNYQDIEAIKTLDFVIMFLPIEPAYLVAIQEEPQLWSMAYEKRILLVSPTNLVAILKMIESMWTQESQNKNVMEIAKQGGALYDDFVRLSENLIKLGRKIDDASIHYKDTMKKISEGRGNLVGRVQKLKVLGVKASKNLPEGLLNRSLDTDEIEPDEDLTIDENPEE